MTFHKIAFAGLALIASFAGTPVSATELAVPSYTVRPHAARSHVVREVVVRPRFDWNYNHVYGPATTWPDGTPATPDRVIVRPGYQPIGLYQGHYPHCLYGAATYRAQGGRYPCG